MPGPGARPARAGRVPAAAAKMAIARHLARAPESARGAGDEREQQERPGARRRGARATGRASSGAQSAPSAVQTMSVGQARRRAASKRPTTSVPARWPRRARASRPSSSSRAVRSRRAAADADAEPTPAGAGAKAGSPRSASIATQSLLGQGLAVRPASLRVHATGRGRAGEVGDTPRPSSPAPRPGEGGATAIRSDCRTGSAARGHFPRGSSPPRAPSPGRASRCASGARWAPGSPPRPPPRREEEQQREAARARGGSGAADGSGSAPDQQDADHRDEAEPGGARAGQVSARHGDQHPAGRRRARPGAATRAAPRAAPAGSRSAAACATKLRFPSVPPGARLRVKRSVSHAVRLQERRDRREHGGAGERQRAGAARVRPRAAPAPPRRGRRPRR